MTGLSWDPDPAIAEKYVEFLNEIVPGLGTVGAIIDPTVRGISEYQKANERAAIKLGLKLHFAQIRVRDDISVAFDRVSSARAKAVVVYGSPLVLAALGDIVAMAAKHRLPAAYIFPRAVALGGLMSYGPDSPDLYRRAAAYVDKILKGATPGDLPVEQPSKFFLAVNPRTARTLGLTIPPSLLLRADHVIE